jgi:predicted CXXCH cytochrome family protein
MTISLLREKKHSHLLAFLFLLFFSFSGSICAQDDDECYACHGDRGFTTERDGRTISLWVNQRRFSNSVHSDLGCISCHSDASAEHFLNDEPLAKVECDLCHTDAVEKFQDSLHGVALSRGRYLAPSCLTCHGKHDILSSSNPDSKTYVRNVPALCGSCHKEGTPVSELRTVAEGHVLEDYSQSIHGDGLFRRGLIVTAVCTSCHNSHDILPHENPASSIHRANIAETCMQCHAQIEQVHLKVIRGELWEKRPHEIPSCIDCHQPHKIRRVFYEESFPDTLCMSCHSNPDLQKEVDGETVSLYVDQDEVIDSAHGGNSCIKCHTNVTQNREPVCKESGRVDCSMCHAEEVELYNNSQHGIDYAGGNPNAPYCTDCHSSHGTKKKDELDSPIFTKNIPDLCGKCHRDGEKAALVYQGKQEHILQKYSMSIHGKGLLESGLLVTATCVDCHSAHRELPADNPDSSVSGQNIAATCGNCHLGISEEFKSSIHSREVNDTEEKLPVCSDCHLSHTIKRVDQTDFRQEIIDQCGKCHLEVMETYFDTFHGKVSRLGSTATARCYDCHGAHSVHPTSDSRSTLSRENVVETCRTCHPNSNRKFVGYLTHATHHDKTKYPYLFYTFWFMTTLLVSVFTFFGIHTALWLPRALRSRRSADAPVSAAMKGRYYQRFDPFSRFLHLLVILSFLTLAVTGMTIKFSDVAIFQTVSHFMGGTEVTTFAHRVAAIVTFAYFFLHLGYLIRKMYRQKTSLKQLFTGENTLMFRRQDLTEFIATMKWFLGTGPRPSYGRWTYWEKFDYFAVFWGVAIIGASGLILWFSEFFTKLGVPGWFINVATIIHSDEALLATGFIFTIHFFNTHFRPDKFPMDPVIFTGSVPLDELKEDRPREYKLLMESRKIKGKLVAPPPVWLQKAARVFGMTCLAIGLFTVLLIIYSMIFVYK